MHQSNDLTEQKPDAREPIWDPRLAYDKAFQNVALVSQELYSRSRDMLTIHGFFLAAIGLVLTRTAGAPVDRLVLIALPVAGLALCRFWRRFVAQGISAQVYFRAKAVEIEKAYFDQSVRIFTDLSKHVDIDESAQRPPSQRRSNYEYLSGLVIRVFELLLTVPYLVYTSRSTRDMKGHAD